MRPRPKTLAEVADRVREGSSSSYELSDFLDEFYQSPSAAALRDEPRSLTGVVEDGPRQDAFLAATAEKLSSKYGFPAPPWVFGPGRSLDEPYFDFKTRAGRLFLLKDSPAAFKSRNLFVTAAVLDRV